MRILSYFPFGKSRRRECGTYELKFLLRSGFFIFAVLMLSLFFNINTSWAVVDLKVQSISVSPNTPAFNQPVTVTVKVRNNGDEALFDNTGLGESAIDVNFIDFEQTGIILPSVSAGAPFEPNKELSYTVSGSFYSKGSKNVNFQVDQFDQVDEWKEDNNSLTIKVSVVEQYDLLVNGITLLPSKPANGQDCVITVAIKNNGYASLKTMTGVSSIIYDIEDFIESDRINPEIDSNNRVLSGESFYYIFKGKFNGPGDKEMTFSIDTNDNIAEKDENNNSISKTLTIASQSAVDISVSSITLDKTDPILGESVKITVKIKNSGSVSLISDAGLRHEKNITVLPIIDAEVRYVFEDFKVESFSASEYPSANSPFDPNEELAYSYTGAFYNNPGERKLEFFIDTNERLRDFNPANNTLAKSVFVYDNATARDEFEIIESKVEAVSSSSVRVSFRTTKKASGRASYKRHDFTGWKDTSGSTDYDHSWIIGNLERNFRYDYTITAVNDTVTKTQEDLVFTTPATDNVAIIDGPRLAISGSKASLDWKTDMIADSYIYYKPIGANGYTKHGTTDLVSEHSVAIDSLNEGEYEYYIYSKNKPGVVVESVVKKFTIGSKPEEIDDTESSDETEETEEAEEVLPVNTERVSNQEMYGRLKGQIVLTVERNGEAYYVNPANQMRHYLGRPDDAFSVMREQGFGITNENLYKIPVGTTNEDGIDTDGDGLSDYLEDTLGLDKMNDDTDGDGYFDGNELKGGHSPWGAGKQAWDDSFSKGQAGKIFLQVEKNGEAWYVSPGDNKRYFLGRPNDAFTIMRTLGLGISNSDFDNL